MTPTYSKINPQELADMKEKYGPWLDEQEVLYLIKREREQGMREELFHRTPGTEVNTAIGGEYYTTPRDPNGASQEVSVPVVKPARVTEEQIVQAARFTDPWKLVAFILAFTIGWAWLLARWFR